MEVSLICANTCERQAARLGRVIKKLESIGETVEVSTLQDAITLIQGMSHEPVGSESFEKKQELVLLMLYKLLLRLPPSPRGWDYHFRITLVITRLYLL